MYLTAANGATLRPLATKPQVDWHDRSHWQHGPIDIVLDLYGSSQQIIEAKHAIWHRFPECLPELVSELTWLKMPCTRYRQDELKGPIAHRMFKAVWPFRDQFITPMAAVAGSVAQELLAIATAFGLLKVIVNNGGDIAFYAAANEKVSIALLAPLGIAEVVSTESCEYGMATSGWSGRSFSLGIADAVTVLAKTAGQADAAATMIANAVGPELHHAAIQRRAASSLKDDSDLGDRLVTLKVGMLPRYLVTQALLEGQRYARRLLERGLILSATLSLQAESVIVTKSGDGEGRQQLFQFKLAA